VAKYPSETKFSEKLGFSKVLETEFLEETRFLSVTIHKKRGNYSALKSISRLKAKAG